MVMEARLFQRVAALIALVTVVAISGASSTARAQDEVLRAPDASGPLLEAFPDDVFTPSLPESTVIESTPEPGLEPTPDSATTSPAPVATNPCPTCQAGGYWIVSSRHCSSHDAARVMQCPLRYYFVEPNKRVRIASEQEMVAALPPGAPVCIVVHGSFHSWESVASESSKLYDWLNPAGSAVHANVIFFTWPSEKPNTMIFPLDFAILGRRSEFHGAYLARLIAKIPADRPLSLVGHSHGARTVSTALQLRAGGKVEDVQFGRAPDFDRRVRVVLVAAAIDNSWLRPGHRFGMAITGSEHFINLRNRDDAALTLYPLRRVFSGEALGKTGFTPRSRRELGELSSRVGEIDVTRQIGSGHMLYNYVEHPEIARSIAPTLFYTDAQPTEVPSAPTQAEQENQQMSYVVPQRKAADKKPISQIKVRETFSNIGRSRPTGRL
jgi:esterase/lipase superfamily enzyme